MRILVLALVLALAGGCTAERDDIDMSAADPSAPDTTTPPIDDTPSPTPIPETVPERFQGSYAADAEACAASTHETQLTIAADSIAFYESSGPITQVASGENDISITAGLTGEGETREATYSFRLADDGTTLTDVGSGMARQRCG